MALQRHSAARADVLRLQYDCGSIGSQKRAEQLTHFLAEVANRGQWGGAVHWAEVLSRRGPTLAVLREIEVAVQQVEKPVSPQLDESGKRFVWVGAGVQMDDVDTYFALVAMEIIERGFGKRLRRCAQQDCRKFFLGDTRAKWCSNACGSKHRVRAKRKLDRARGIA